MNFASNWHTIKNIRPVILIIEKNSNGSEPNILRCDKGHRMSACVETSRTKEPLNFVLLWTDSLLNYLLTMGSKCLPQQSVRRWKQKRLYFVVME